MRRVLAVLLLTTLVALAVLAAPAAAQQRRALCSRTANLRDSPNGFVIGRLTRPQRLVVMRRSANRRWTHVRVRSGIAGWIPSTSVCRRRG